METPEKPAKVMIRRKKAFTVSKGKVVSEEILKIAQEPKKERPPKKHHVSVKQSFIMLKNRWPKLFNTENPKPLKIGITAEIKKDQSIKPSEMKEIDLAIRRYCNSYRYQKAIIKGTHRYDIEGNPVQEIDETHKNWAKMKLKIIKRKMKAAKKIKATAEKSPV